MLKDNLALFVGGVLTGAVNYFLYPVVSRFVTVEEFGEIQILLSLMMQLGIAGTVIRIFMVNVLKDETDEQVVGKFLRNTSRTLFILGVVIASIVLALSPLLKDALQFNSIYALIPTALAAIMAFQFSVPVSYLQAIKKFQAVSILQFLQALTKLVFAGLLGALGFGSIGVVWGVVLAGVAVWLGALNKTKNAFKPQLKAIENNRLKQKAQFAWGPLKSQAKYILLITLATGSVVVFLSLDTFFAKYYFSPEDAGLYAGVAVVGRTLFYLTGSVSAVMISSVKPSLNMKSNLKSYLLSLGLITAVSVTALAVIIPFSSLITEILLGSQYTIYSSLLSKLAVAMAALALVNLVVAYHIALKEKYITIPIVSGLMLTVALLVGSSEGIDKIATSFLSGITITLVLCLGFSLIWNYKAYGRQQID